MGVHKNCQVKLILFVHPQNRILWSLGDKRMIRRVCAVSSLGLARVLGIHVREIWTNSTIQYNGMWAHAHLTCKFSDDE